MRHIHLRDPQIPQTSLCFDQRLQDWQLTDDPASVTCKRCRRMMERRAKYEAKERVKQKLDTVKGVMPWGSVNSMAGDKSG